MNDLPELPFEKVLSYLSFEDRLKARAVSRRWYHQINRFKVKTLCYSQHPAGFILGKRRLVSGAFAQNFISSTRFKSFKSFCNTFRPTILANLKHLRLCGLSLNGKKNMPAFLSTLQSFGQLEELDIIQFDCFQAEIELTLPMLTSIQLEKVHGIKKLTLDAPRLLKIKLNSLWLRLELVHAESVEWLMINASTAMEVKSMKKLKVLYLHGRHSKEIDSTFLSSLEHLREVHLFENYFLDELFERKQRHGRTDLKIYLCGLLLNGPSDPAITSFEFDLQEPYFDGDFGCLVENPTRLADQIPFATTLEYEQFERVASGTSVWKRFTDLKEIWIHEPVEDTERFLNLLRNVHNIERLLVACDQPQDLFDGLPEHSAVQWLIINQAPSDIRFLFRLHHLVYLTLEFSIDAEAIRKVLENEFLSLFEFSYRGKRVRIVIEYPKRFKVRIGTAAWRGVPNPDAAIEFITSD